MAISLAFGVLFSSVITLFIVPAGYIVLEDAQTALTRLRTFRNRGRNESAPLAGH
jgi:hypothetical protein